MVLKRTIITKIIVLVMPYVLKTIRICPLKIRFMVVYNKFYFFWNGTKFQVNVHTLPQPWFPFLFFLWIFTLGRCSWPPSWLQPCSFLFTRGIRFLTFAWEVSFSNSDTVSVLLCLNLLFPSKFFTTSL